MAGSAVLYSVTAGVPGNPSHTPGLIVILFTRLAACKHGGDTTKRKKEKLTKYYSFLLCCMCINIWVQDVKNYYYKLG